MSSSPQYRRHLLPLLEFIQHVMNRSNDEDVRLPRKFNGTLDGRSFYPDLSDASQSESMVVVSDREEDTFPPEARKRERTTIKLERTDSPHRQAVRLAGFCHPNAVQGFLRSDDALLSSIGLSPLVSGSQPVIKNSERKSTLGSECCCFYADTSEIITGNIVDLSADGTKAQICPDRGIHVPLMWKEISALYQIPSNIDEIRCQLPVLIQRVSIKHEAECEDT